MAGRGVRMRNLARTRQVRDENLKRQEVLAALRAQKLQVSAGIRNQPPAPVQGGLSVNLRHSAGCTRPSNSVHRRQIESKEG